MWLERGEHVTLVGANGTGKTTLIETLAGKRELAAGKLSTGHNVNHRLRLSARRGAVGAGLAARRHAARHGAHPRQGACPAGDVPVLGRGGREAHQRAVGRRAPAVLAGGARELGGEPARARRAHQPPRPGESRGPRGRAAAVPGLAPARLARPRAARRRGHAHARDRGRRAAQLRGQLGGVRAGQGRAARGRAAGRAPDAPAPAPRRRHRRARQRPRMPSKSAKGERARKPRTARRRTVARDPRRTRRRPSGRWSANSRRPRRRCASSRTSWPTPLPGRIRRPRPARANVTPGQSGRWRSSTPAGRPSLAERRATTEVYLAASCLRRSAEELAADGPRLARPKVELPLGGLEDHRVRCGYRLRPLRVKAAPRELMEVMEVGLQLRKRRLAEGVVHEEGASR